MPYCEVACDLSPLGLRCGWGKDVGRIKEMIAMLQDILQVGGKGRWGGGGGSSVAYPSSIKPPFQAASTCHPPPPAQAPGADTLERFLALWSPLSTFYLAGPRR